MKDHENEERKKTQKIRIYEILKSERKQQVAHIRLGRKRINQEFKTPQHPLSLGLRVDEKKTRNLHSESTVVEC